MGFEVDGLDEFQKLLLQLADKKFPSEKKKELKRLGKIVEREIKAVTPVDTGRLRNSFLTEVIDKNTAIVGTNVEYAKWVNDGHMQSSHFVSKEMLRKSGGKNWQKYNVDTSVESKVGSTSYIQETIKLPITDKRVKGFMTKPKYIKGIHFMEKGLQSAEPLIYAELNRWLTELLKKVGE